MYSLPTEAQFDVFKYLNFDQFFSIKQTNLYFRNFINKYENELAHLEFFEIDIVDIDQCSTIAYLLIKPIPETFNFPVSKQLEETWKDAIEKSIPLYLQVYESIENLVVRLYKEELIEILFENEATNIPLKFNTKEAIISTCFKNGQIKSFLKLSLEYFFISESFEIFFGDIAMDNTEEYIYILLNILINEGSKFPNVWYICLELPELYDLLIKNIEISKDCSKIVKEIRFGGVQWPIILSERAENIKKEGANCYFKFTSYQLSNIHNPKVKFSIYNKQNDDGTISDVEIERIN
uniref:F-box domain-containing protein n=1 Tax=Meloidogyne hapla TaxID=6305 RepID=A0A1I8B5I1_MELHA